MIEAAARHALAEALGDHIEFEVSMARHSALRIGGPVDAMITPRDRAGLERALAICHAYGVPTRTLGSGFNVLVSDRGLAGAVIRLKKMRSIERTSKDSILVEAGASHATITRYCLEHGLSGLEFGAGIPGTLGGWLAMNAGIGVREIKDVVRRIDFVDRTGAIQESVARKHLEFRYRELAGLPEGTVLVAAELEVLEVDPAEVQSEIDRLLAHRQATQPTDIPSCGSVFRNPPGDYAGRLIESAGLKGTREGAAEISSVHANFIVNHGGATAQDVLRLIERARETVLEQTGIQLETEVQLIGVPEGAAE